MSGICLKILVIICSLLEFSYSIRCPLTNSCLYEIEFTEAGNSSNFKCFEPKEVSHLNISEMMSHFEQHQPESLNITHCHHIHFDSDTLNSSSLEKFTANGNNIKRISKRSFSAFPNLTELNLSDNQINKIVPLAFAGLKLLRILDLSHNRLSVLNSVLLHDQTALEVINLSHNSLIEISVETFEHLGQLRELNLEFNFCISSHYKDNTSLQIHKFAHDFHDCSCSENLRELTHQYKKLGLDLKTKKDQIEKLQVGKEKLQAIILLTSLTILIGFSIFIYKHCKSAEEVHSLNYRYDTSSEQLMVVNSASNLNLNHPSVTKFDKNDKNASRLTLCSEI